MDSLIAQEGECHVRKEMRTDGDGRRMSLMIMSKTRGEKRKRIDGRATTNETNAESHPVLKNPHRAPRGE